MKRPTFSVEREKDEWLHIQSESISYNFTEDKSCLSPLTAWQIPSISQCLLQWRIWQWMHFRQADEEKIRNRKEVSQLHSGEPGTVQSYMGHSYCLVHTQLFCARQQVLFIRQDVVEDKKLGGDGVALSSSSTALPLLTNNKREKQNNSYRSGTSSTIGLCIINECGDGYV